VVDHPHPLKTAQLIDVASSKLNSSHPRLGLRATLASIHLTGTWAGQPYNIITAYQTTISCPRHSNPLWNPSGVHLPTRGVSLQPSRAHLVYNPHRSLGSLFMKFRPVHDLS